MTVKQHKNSALAKERGKKVITESDSVTLEGIPEDTGENKQNLLNVLLLAMEMQDDKTLLNGMEEYIKRKPTMLYLYEEIKIHSAIIMPS